MIQVAALPRGTIRRREVCLVAMLEWLSHAGVGEHCVGAGWGRVVPVAQERDEVLVRLRNIGVASAFDRSTSSAHDCIRRIRIRLSHDDCVQRYIRRNIECFILRSIRRSNHRSVGQQTIRSRHGIVARCALLDILSRRGLARTAQTPRKLRYFDRALITGEGKSAVAVHGGGVGVAEGGRGRRAGVGGTFVN